jgi:WD40 repeat protein
MCDLSKCMMVVQSWSWEILTLMLFSMLQVSCVRMLSGDRVLTASHDGSLKMWDIRTDSCVATVGKSTSSVLCMDYDDSSGVLAAAGVDGVGNVWDIRGGKQMQRLVGHTKWIRSLRMVGDIIVTGSDDWTARVWSASRGSCDAVLASHAGAVTNVEFCAADSGIITGTSLHP